jgi:predicted anti-sigma-YlaC factor YlaD
MSMNRPCDSYVECIQDYVDGYTHSSPDMCAHLKSCPNCHDYFLELVALKQVLKRCDNPLPTSDCWAKIEKQLCHEGYLKQARLAQFLIPLTIAASVLGFAVSVQVLNHKNTLTAQELYWRPHQQLLPGTGGLYSNYRVIQTQLQR